MFDSWRDARTLRLLTPPRAVVIDWHMLDPTAGRPFGFAADGVTLRTRASGARIDHHMPASQLAWLKLFDGQWRAICSVTIASGNAHSQLDLTILVPPDALTVRST